VQADVPFGNRLIACTGGVASGALQRHIDAGSGNKEGGWVEAGLSLGREKEGERVGAATVGIWNKHERYPAHALRQVFAS